MTDTQSLLPAIDLLTGKYRVIAEAGRASQLEAEMDALLHQVRAALVARDGIWETFPAKRADTAADASAQMPKREVGRS